MNRFIRSKVLVILSVLLLSIIVIGCKTTQPQPTLSFNKTEWTVVEEEEFTLIPVITNLEGTDLVNFEFDVDGIVSYTNGTFIAMAEGVVHITASLEGYPDISETITVTVGPKLVEVIEVTAISVSGLATMIEEEEQTLTVSVLPLDADDASVTWSTSDASIATVNNGVVSALSAGSVIITATAHDGSGVTGTFNITIEEKIVIITGEITLTGDKTEGFVGDQVTLTAVVDTNATDESIAWSVDSSKATVEDGVVSLVGSGSVVVTATLVANNEITTTYTITIYDKITSITLTAGKDYYAINDTETLIPVISPVLVKNEVSWTSSDETVVSVNNGVIQCLKEGTATITATALDGSTITGSVVINVLGVSVDMSTTLADLTVSGLALGTEISFGGMTFNAGLNAFATLSEAVSKSTCKTYVASGNYSEDVTISIDDFQLIGPNADINPLTGVRLSEAVMSGKISIAKNLKNIVINGLAFTGKGMIDGLGNNDGVEVLYNKVYDTNTDVIAWIETRTESEAVFDFWSVYTEESKNINIQFNCFTNVKETNIMVARAIDVTVSNNGFYNFGMDAIRCEGGYNYGDWIFENNEFINDVQGGNNGIYLQSVSGILEDAYQTILIKNSVFKNIGIAEAASSYNCAISIRTYQEKGLQLDILYNTFENCVNYLNLRDNGAIADTFISNVNYNKFVGVPSGVYHRNIRPGSTDTLISNLPLTNMDYNYFEDISGTPIADLSSYADKLLDLKSYANNFATKAAYEEVIKSLNGIDFTMVVNPDWVDLADNTKVQMENFTWTIGIDAFTTIEAAIAAASDGEIIKVAAGMYSTALSITKNNITLLGANAGVNPVYENRQNESHLDKEIVIEVGVSGFTIDGFELSGAARLVLKNNTANTALKNNVMSGTTADGIVRGPEFGSETTTNVIMNYNYSSSFSSYRFGWFMNVDGLEMIGNSITCTSAPYDFLNVQGFIKGTVTINDNTYINSNQSFIYVKGVGVLSATIEGNYVENVANAVIDFRNMVEDGAVIFDIRYNTFVSAGKGWCPVRIRTAGYDVNDSIAINLEFNKFIDSYYTDTTPVFIENPSLSTALEGLQKIYVVGRNYYEINGVALTVLTDAHFTNAAISIADAYATMSEVPAYEKENEVKPTAIQITNKITEIGAFETHQILFKMTPSDVTNKKVAFATSDATVATVSSAGLLNAKSEGTCTITVYSMADNEILDTFTITIIPMERIEVRYGGNAVILSGQTVALETSYLGPDSDVTMTFSSLDTNIATVNSSGVVSAVAPGVVLISVKYGEIEAVVGFTVISSTTPLSDVLQLFADANNGIVDDKTIVYIGSDDGSADYPHDIYNSVSDYWSSVLPTVTRNMLSTTAANYDGNQMESIEFIVIHDTAGSGSTSTAWANSHWCTNTSNTGSSWHYTIGNDGIYQQVEDDMVTWHAGDGTSWGDSTTLYDTGVAYEGERPTVTIEADGFFYINDKKTTVVAPTGTTTINTLGMVCFKGTNGNYVIPTTWRGTSYGQVICARGGNLNGIGIETAVNMGSDVYLTWQTTAKFVAELLVKHNLTPDRVWFHNNFSNKPCPRSMMTAGLVDDFLEMVYTEYDVLKNYDDYSITFTSSNPDIIDNSGRVIGAPNFTTNVTYTVTVEKSGVSESIVLNALVVGKYN
ncbi:MAG: Ig-like domain-containing protein [Bacilli bacterium]